MSAWCDILVSYFVFYARSCQQGIRGASLIIIGSTCFVLYVATAESAAQTSFFFVFLHKLVKKPFGIYSFVRSRWMQAITTVLVLCCDGGLRVLDRRVCGWRIPTLFVPSMTAFTSTFFLGLPLSLRPQGTRHACHQVHLVTP